MVDTAVSGAGGRVDTSVSADARIHTYICIYMYLYASPRCARRRKLCDIYSGDNLCRLYPQHNESCTHPPKKLGFSINSGLPAKICISRERWGPSVPTSSLEVPDAPPRPPLAPPSCLSIGKVAIRGGAAACAAARPPLHAPPCRGRPQVSV